MDQFDISYARDHLPELMERAARGEVVSIIDPERGTFVLRPQVNHQAESAAYGS